MKNIKESASGLTLVELIISIAIIGIIVASFMPVFVMSAKTNHKSETTLDATYLGRDAMELAYKLSRNVSYEDLDNKFKEEFKDLLKDKFKEERYSSHTAKDTFLYGYEYDDKKYLNMKFSKENNLVRIVAKVYEDKSMNHLQVQYESLYSWIGRGILSEK